MVKPQDILKILMLPVPQESQIDAPAFGAPTEMSEAEFLAHVRSLRPVDMRIDVSAAGDAQIWHGPLLVATVSHWEYEGQRFLIVRLYPHSVSIINQSIESAIAFELIAINIVNQIDAYKAREG